MQLAYFPGPILCWIYLAVLLGLLSIASYTDLRSLTIPKWISLVALAVGVLINIVRGAALGAAGGEVFVIGEPGGVLGGLDGFLFALAGFVLGFLIFFGLWLLGICGGGDVKLFAALGAWTGPRLLIMILIVTLLLVAVVTFARLAGRILTGKGIKLQKMSPPSLGRKKGKAPLQPKHRALGFALPLALACLVVLPWTFRFDLRLAEPRPAAHAAADLSHRP